MLPITGLTVVAPPPVGVAHIRLERGLNLLYGVNGVGKTRTLEAIRQTLTRPGRTTSDTYFDRSAVLAGDRKNQIKNRTPTDFCNRALIIDGGVHIHAPFAQLGAEDQAFRILALATGYTPSGFEYVGDQAREIADGWIGETGPSWMELEDDLQQQLWRSLKRDDLRDALVEQIKIGATWRDPTTSQCESLVDDGYWMLTTDGRLLASIAPSKHDEFDWLASNIQWRLDMDLLKESRKRLNLTRTSKDPAVDQPIEFLDGLSLSDLAFLGQGVSARLPFHPERLGINCEEWLAIPIASIGRFRENDSTQTEFGWSTTQSGSLSDLVPVATEVPPNSIGGTDSDLERRTFIWIVEESRRLHREYSQHSRNELGNTNEIKISTYIGTNGKISQFLAESAASLSFSATQLFAEFFSDAPELQLQITDPESWFAGTQRIEWLAKTNNAELFPISEMGSAHLRFANFAINSALQKPTVISDPTFGGQADPTVVTLIDEPERALHSSGEEEVFAHLVNLGNIVVAATHSPKLIADSSVNMLHIVRGSHGTNSISSYLGGLTGNPNKSPAEIARELGVTLADLVSVVKVVLLVEGPHDEEIINFMCPEVKGPIDVLCIPLMGYEDMPQLANSRFLTTMTDARIIVVTDNANNQLLSQLKRDAIEERDRGKPWKPVFAQARYRKEPPPTKEERALANLLENIIGLNRESQFHIVGSPQLDIAMYLPANKICPEFSSWDDLQNAFLDDRGRGWKAGDGALLKKWVSAKPGGRYNLKGIRQALSDLSNDWSESGGVVNNRDPFFSDLAELVQRLR